MLFSSEYFALLEFIKWVKDKNNTKTRKRVVTTEDLDIFETLRYLTRGMQKGVCSLYEQSLKVL